MTTYTVIHTEYAYDNYVNSIRMTARTIPSSVASVVESLELRLPPIVTRALLAEISQERGLKLSADQLIDRLVRAGWLIPLRTPDAWEFAPGARAGRIGSGDSLIELKALLLHQPEAPVAIAGESAVWELGYSTHQPNVPVLAHRPGWRPPESLKARMVTFEWRCPVGETRGLPLWRPATVVVAAARRPANHRDWGNADEWLPETFRAASSSDVILEAEGRGHATLARLGYFAEWSGRFDVADTIETFLPDKLKVSYLGPRHAKGRWVNRWRLYDSLLPTR